MLDVLVQGLDLEWEVLMGVVAVVVMAGVLVMYVILLTPVVLLTPMILLTPIILVTPLIPLFCVTTKRADRFAG